MTDVHVPRVRVAVVALGAASVAVLLLGGCASGQAGDGSPGPSSPEAAAETPGDREEGQRSGEDSGGGAAAVDETISVRVADGDVRPAPGRVEVDRGFRVRIRVSSDQPDQLHVHGYDKTARMRPGKAAVVEFVADQTGLFEVETHHGGLLLFQLLVR